MYEGLAWGAIESYRELCLPRFCRDFAGDLFVYVSFMGACLEPPSMVALIKVSMSMVKFYDAPIAMPYFRVE